MTLKPLPLLLVTLLFSTLVAAVTSTVLRPASVDAGADAVAERAELARLTLALERANERQESLARDLAALAARAPSGSSRVAVDDLDAAVARYFAERDAAATEGREGDAAGPEAGVDGRAASDRRRVEEAFAALIGGELDQEARQRVWAELTEAGLSEELLAEFEARAEREPNDPDLRVDLGEAYLQKVFEAGNGPMAGVWAMKADGAFDAALELDPDHWEARFSKAISLSFWPPALGKQNEAIAQFEVLLEKQAGMPKQDGHAQTYLFLGNMYQQTGQGALALETWQKGMALFPDNEALTSQVGLVQGN